MNSIIDKYSHLFLLFVVLWLPLGLFIVYVIAIFNKTINIDFPCISAAANSYPASSIFGQILDILSLNIFILSCVRYSHIEYLNSFAQKHISYPVYVMNRASIFLSIGTVIGFTIVGNFQQHNFKWFHIIVALLVFISFLLYLLLQTIISHYFKCLLYSPKPIFTLRIIAFILSTMTFVFLIIYENILLSERSLVDHSYNDDELYNKHGMCALFEWLICIMIALLYLTFYPDYKNIKLNKPDELTYRVSNLVDN